MSDSQIDRLSPCERPADRIIGYQKWRHLFFLHWRFPVDVVAPLLPDSLTVDTFEGDAWVGLVPFHMMGVRPWWFPPVPGLSTFHETNVRTYVHLNGKDPGVWFFSLEAANSIAVRVARRFWNLEYHRATMSISQTENRFCFESERRWPGQIGAGGVIDVEVGEPYSPVTDQKAAIPGTLEHFLAERYYLYTQNKRGELIRGQVHHTPYPLYSVTLHEFSDTLLSAAGLKTTEQPCHILHAPGVDVDIYPLKKVARSSNFRSSE